MKEVRKCKYCGKELVPRSGMQRYCCEECQTKAKEARKKRQQDFMNAVEPVIDLQCQEYLTFAKAAILMGCSRQYVYKLVNEGKLAASRISSRMAFIRKADIEKMLAGNPADRQGFHRLQRQSHPGPVEELAAGGGHHQAYNLPL
ncbi:MAG: helix-turn-helix domain-containing protein [Prevotella sp.]|nr:helix-turn-helix domain-containing protein [Prevotella sp.]